MGFRAAMDGYKRAFMLIWLSMKIGGGPFELLELIAGRIVVI
jgi:hypothetical protein